MPSHHRACLAITSPRVPCHHITASALPSHHHECLDITSPWVLCHHITVSASQHIGECGGWSTSQREYHCCTPLSARYTHIQYVGGCWHWSTSKRAYHCCTPLSAPYTHIGECGRWSTSQRAYHCCTPLSAPSTHIHRWVRALVNLLIGATVGRASPRPLPELDNTAQE